MSDKGPVMSTNFLIFLLMDGWELPKFGIDFLPKKISKDSPEPSELWGKEQTKYP